MSVEGRGQRRAPRRRPSPPALPERRPAAPRRNRRASRPAAACSPSAVPSRPPAAKYTVMMPPPMSEPSQRGAPVSTLRMAAPAISCAARIHRQPKVTSTDTMPRTAGAVAMLEEVAGGVEVVLLGQRPEPRPHPEGEHERRQARRSAPPPRAQAVAVGEAGGVDRGAGADVGREHRREDEAGTEAAAGDEEVAAAAHEARRPQAEADDGDRVDRDECEVRAHERGSARCRRKPNGGFASTDVDSKASICAGQDVECYLTRAGAVPSDRADGRPPSGSAVDTARTMASASTSAASAPMIDAFISPVQRLVASANTVSPSPVVCDGVDGARQRVVGHQRDAAHVRLRQLRVRGDDGDRGVAAGARCRRRSVRSRPSE